MSGSVLTGGAAAESRDMIHHVLPPPGAPRFEPFGPTSRARRLAAASLVAAGAVPVWMVASRNSGPPPRLQLVLLAIGVVAMLAWLVDGRSYLGPGAAALAVGLAITVARETVLEDREYTLVFGLLGAAFLLIAQVNPSAIRGTAGLMFFVSASTVWLHRADQPLVPAQVLFPAIMLAWGGLRLLQILAQDEKAPVRAGPRSSAA